MTTLAGHWQVLANECLGRIARARGFAAGRFFVLQETPFANALPPLNVFVRTAIEKRLEQTVSTKTRVSPPDLIARANGLSRLLILCSHNPDLKILTSQSWDVAMEIVRWYDHDPLGASLEAERYQKLDEDIGPRFTKRRRKQALSITSTDVETIAPSFSKKLDIDCLVQNGFSSLRFLLPHFAKLGYETILGDFVASHLPDMIAKPTPYPKFWEDFAEIAINEPSFQTTAAPGLIELCLKHLPKISDHVRSILLKVAAHHDGPGIRGDYRELLLSWNVPIKPSHDHRVGLPPNSRWRNKPRQYCLDLGRVIADRDVVKWTKIINEYGDPENHPLNFLPIVPRPKFIANKKK